MKAHNPAAVAAVVETGMPEILSRRRYPIGSIPIRPGTVRISPDYEPHSGSIFRPDRSMPNGDRAAECTRTQYFHFEHNHKNGNSHAARDRGTRHLFGLIHPMTKAVLTETNYSADTSSSKRISSA